MFAKKRYMDAQGLTHIFCALDVHSLDVCFLCTINAVTGTLEGAEGRIEHLLGLFRIDRLEKVMGSPTESLSWIFVSKYRRRHGLERRSSTRRVASRHDGPAYFGIRSSPTNH